MEFGYFYEKIFATNVFCKYQYNVIKIKCSFIAHVHRTYYCIPYFAQFPIHCISRCNIFVMKSMIFLSRLVNNIGHCTQLIGQLLSMRFNEIRGTF